MTLHISQSLQTTFDGLHLERDALDEEVVEVEQPKPFVVHDGGYFAHDAQRRLIEVGTHAPAADSKSLAQRQLDAAAVDGALRGFIEAGGFPCVGAKSAFVRGNYRLSIHGGLAEPRTLPALCRNLQQYVGEVDNMTAGGKFATFVAVFRSQVIPSELAFEHLLWRQLQMLHDACGKPWDDTVSSDPSNPHFSFSFGGRAFFIVGMHPRASRVARRFCWPTLVFNLHEQFEQLREDGKMPRMQQVIRDRDRKLQGTINPNLRDFGDATEARQYSGRPVEPSWTPPLVVDEPAADKPAARCPFHRTDA